MHKKTKGFNILQDVKVGCRSNLKVFPLSVTRCEGGVSVEQFQPVEELLALIASFTLLGKNELKVALCVTNPQPSGFKFDPPLTKGKPSCALQQPPPSPHPSLINRRHPHWNLLQSNYPNSRSSADVSLARQMSSPANSRSSPEFISPLHFCPLITPDMAAQLRWFPSVLTRRSPAVAPRLHTAAPGLTGSWGDYVWDDEVGLSPLTLLGCPTFICYWPNGKQPSITHTPARARYASVPNSRACTSAIYPLRRGGDPLSSRERRVGGGSWNFFMLILFGPDSIFTKCENAGCN